MSRTLIDVAFLVGIAATWLLGGRRLLPRALRSEHPLLVAASSLGLAAGSTATVVTLLAMVGLLRPIAVWSIAIGWTALAALEWRSFRRSQSHLPVPARSGPWQMLMIAALAIAALLTLIGALAPPTSMDAMVYHLRIPKLFIRQGRVVGLLDDVHSFQPLNVEMLFAFGMVLRDDILAALMHWLLGVGAGLAAGAWGGRLGARSPVTTVALFVITPLVVWEATSSFIDLGLTLFAALGLLWATRTDLGKSSLALATVFGGLAVGTKFTGCAVAALIGLVVFVNALPDVRRATARFLAVGAGTAVIGSPWYIRNAVFTGNPFYPLANRLFGVPEPPHALSNWTYGYGTDVLHLLSSPIDLTWRGAAFDAGWALGPAYLALIPIAVVGSYRQAVHRTCALVLAIFWVFWFYSSPQTRLLLPVLPLAAALSAVGFDTLASLGRWTRLAAWATAALSVALGLGTAFLIVRGSWAVVTGRESKVAYLRRMAWDFAAYEQVNQRLGEDARLAVLGTTGVYYLDPETTVVLDADAATLARQGFTHLLTILECANDRRPVGVPLWSGRYQRQATRFQGLPGGTEMCATLSRLDPRPPER